MRGTVTVSLGLTCILVGAALFFWYYRKDGGAGGGSFLGIALTFVGVGGVLGGLAARHRWGCWYGFVLAPAIIAILYYIVAISLFH